MKKNYVIVCISLVYMLFFEPNVLLAFARKRKKSIPTIETQWLDQNDTTRYRLQSPHLFEYPTFGFDIQTLNRFFLPQDHITYHNGTNVIESSELKKIIQQTIEEINQKKKLLTHATILQDKNYNKRKGCGLLVVKLNEPNPPFVIKLFKETPQSFVNPYCKGIEPICFFFMGNGANRHLAGFTRLINRELITKKLNNLEKWRDKVEVPRKWLWLPENPEWITIYGYNFGKKNHELKTTIPGTYAIIADAITPQEKSPMPVRKKKSIVMKLCNDLDSLIDPHFKNFMFTANQDSYKIVIIDTEHFPTMIGLTQPIQFKNHTDYYCYLIRKCFHDTYLQTKVNRKELKKQRSVFLEEFFNKTVA